MKRRLVRQIGFAAAGLALAAVATWWWRRQPSNAAAEPSLPDAWASEELDELPPDSSVFEPAPLSDRELSAQPNAHARRSLSGDDYDAIGVDELGAAFLARATDGGNSRDDDEGDSESLVDNAGFRIITPRDAE